MSDDVTALVDKAVAEEAAEPDPADNGHDWSAVAEIGRSPHAMALDALLIDAGHPHLEWGDARPDGP